MAFDRNRMINPIQRKFYENMVEQLGLYKELKYWDNYRKKMRILEIPPVDMVKNQEKITDFISKEEMEIC